MYFFRGGFSQRFLTFAFGAFGAGGGEHYKEVIFRIKSGGASYNKIQTHLRGVINKKQ